MHAAARRASDATACRRSSAARRGRSPRSATTDSRCCELFAAELELRGAGAALAREPRAGSPSSARRSRRAAGVLRQDRRSTSSLLAQTEVGEVREAAGGGSSTMPHKRNPVGAVLARACAALGRGHASVLLAARSTHEHERAAGAWQAEWDGALGRARVRRRRGGARSRARSSGLEVDAERMRENLDATGGLVLAERVAFAARRAHRARRRARARRGGRRRRRPLVRRRAARTTRGVGARGGRARRRCSTRTPISARPRRWSTARSRATARGGGRRERCTTASTGAAARPSLVLSNSLGTTLELWDAAGRAACAARSGSSATTSAGTATRRVPPGPYTIERARARRRSSCSTSSGSSARLVLRPVARRRGRNVARARTRRSASTGSCSPARRPTSAPPERWHERAAPCAAEGMEAVADAMLGRWFTPAFAAATRRRGALPGDARRDAARGLRRLLRGARRLGLPRPRSAGSRRRRS